MPVSADQSLRDYRPHGFLDFNTYHDSRNFRVHTLNAKLDLPGPFSYFSLTNWQGDATGDEFFDYGNYLTEQNLYYKLGDSAFDINMQYFSLSGNKNDLLRFGPQVRFEALPWLGKYLKKINAWYHFTYFPLQVDHFDDYAFQLQHVWYMKLFPKTFNDRAYLYGFADQNMLIGSQNAHNKLVSELQLGYRVWKDLALVTEARWNGFFPKGDRFGVGVGVQYKVNF